MPISSCVREFLRLPSNKLGLGIPSLKDIAEKMRVLKRNTLRHSPNEDIRQLWSESTTRFVNADTRIVANTPISNAMSSLEMDQQFEGWKHICSLSVQGASARMINDVIPKRSIVAWSSNLRRSSACIHHFALKALQSQLPAAANLVRCKRVQHDECGLCGGTKPQTNNHVLSKCSSSIALGRYRGWHDETLILLARWLQSVLLSKLLISQGFIQLLST